MWRVGSNILASSSRVAIAASASSSRRVVRCMIHQQLNATRQFTMCNGVANSCNPSKSYACSFSSTTTPANYLCVHVFVSVKPGFENEFLQASLANARASSLEPGIARFDVIQQQDDPTKFVLVEVYKDADAPAAHKETGHYLAWRDAVKDMMAEPRSAIKYNNLFPATSVGWDYGNGASLE
jgi:autoinducer 2-degrading protein